LDHFHFKNDYKNDPKISSRFNLHLKMSIIGKKKSKLKAHLRVMDLAHKSRLHKHNQLGLGAALANPISRTHTVDARVAHPRVVHHQHVVQAIADHLQPALPAAHQILALLGPRHAGHGHAADLALQPGRRVLAHLDALGQRAYHERRHVHVEDDGRLGRARLIPRLDDVAAAVLTAQLLDLQRVNVLARVHEHTLRHLDQLGILEFKLFSL